jgi:predicted nucleotidyltransferase
MRATAEDRKRLETEVHRLATQMEKLGAVKVILFGSLARGQISLFSDIDLLVLFDKELSPRALTRWVYQNIQSGEAVDILAYDRKYFNKVREHPFLNHILAEGKVVYERHED